MAFSATKREWSELYAFLRLLSDGFVCEGLPDLSCMDMERIPVAGIKREEHDGTRRYLVEDGDVHIVGESVDKRFPRSRFTTVADKMGWRSFLMKYRSSTSKPRRKTGRISASRFMPRQSRRKVSSCAHASDV